jgi:uncharacterized membrane protein YedE/YeeE
MKHSFYLLIGIYFGIVLYKSEVVSWFRMQEMFRFDSIHMYGIIGVAVALGVLSVQLIKRLGIKATDGSTIDLKPKPLTKANFIGGVLFGMGWALTGACPGPLYALVGGGYPIMAVPLVSAILGALAYGLIKDKLPH